MSDQLFYVVAVFNQRITYKLYKPETLQLECPPTFK